MENKTDSCTYPFLQDCDLCPNFNLCIILQEQNKKATEERKANENKSL